MRYEQNLSRLRRLLDALYIGEQLGQAMPGIDLAKTRHAHIFPDYEH